MAQDDRDKRTHTDENGNEWLTDSEGNLLTDEQGNNIVPTQSKRNSKEGEFTTYDMSKGHCGLCGRLTCTGTCFK